MGFDDCSLIVKLVQFMEEVPELWLKETPTSKRGVSEVMLRHKNHSRSPPINFFRRIVSGLYLFNHLTTVSRDVLHKLPVVEGLLREWFALNDIVAGPPLFKRNNTPGNMIEMYQKSRHTGHGMFGFPCVKLKLDERTLTD